MLKNVENFGTVANFAHWRLNKKIANFPSLNKSPSHQFILPSIYMILLFSKMQVMLLFHAEKSPLDKF
jgi:hypothetical protein